MKKKIAVVAGILVLILLIVLGINRYNRSANPNTYSGTIEATQIPIQPELGGKITELTVQEGQNVKAGDVIAKIDNKQAVITLATAKSQLQQAEDKLSDLLGGVRSEEIRRLQSLLAQAKASAEGLAQNLQFEEQNLADDQKLYTSGTISKKELDAEQNKYNSIKAQYDSAQAQVNAAQASLDQALAGYTEPTIQAQKAAVDMAKQSVQSAELALAKLVIKSPLNGQVLYKHVETGQVVNPGTTLVTLIDPSDLWVKVYIPEAKLNQVKVGGIASVSVDAYANQSFKGEILYINDQAEFTPKNVQTREERTTTVFAVKIRINEGKDLLKAGMPADVSLQ